VAVWSLLLFIAAAYWRSLRARTSLSRHWTAALALAGSLVVAICTIFEGFMVRPTPAAHACE
jgi:hypothetical protein